jgi:predicted transposase/invertase (TIGR01784 family)
LLERALPELYEAADREVEQRFLDKEFRDVLNTADPKIHASPHFADYVLEVPLKNGRAEWIILHIETQQSRGGGDLAERMYHYKSLIYAHYRREPAALAIVVGKRPPNEPLYYSHSLFGTESLYRYNNLVLQELGDDELMASDNPADLVLYAAKCALRSKKELQKYRYLRKLLDLLGERGWGRDDKRDLLLFIERLLYLKDKQLEIQYIEYRNQLNREGKIVFIPMGEREAAREIEQRGIEKGIEKGKLEVARNLLANGVSPDVIAKSAGLPLDQIKSLMN